MWQGLGVTVGVGGCCSGRGFLRLTLKGQRSRRVQDPGPAGVPGGAAWRPRPGCAPTAHDAASQAASSARRGGGSTGARAGARPQRDPDRPGRSNFYSSLGLRAGDAGGRQQLRIRFRFCAGGRANSAGTREGSRRCVGCPLDGGFSGCL